MEQKPFKMMKHAFNFILKSFFVLDILKYICLDFPVMQKNNLFKKIRLISKIMKQFI